MNTFYSIGKEIEDITKEIARKIDPETVKDLRKIAGFLMLNPKKQIAKGKMGGLIETLIVHLLKIMEFHHEGKKPLKKWFSEVRHYLKLISDFNRKGGIPKDKTITTKKRWLKESDLQDISEDHFEVAQIIALDEMKKDRFSNPSLQTAKKLSDLGFYFFINKGKGEDMDIEQKDFLGRFE